MTDVQVSNARRIGFTASESNLFLSGRILSPEGQPLAGARARAFYWDRDAASGDLEQVQVETLADGGERVT